MNANCQIFSNNLNDSLRNLIKSLAREDVRTPRSLLVQMTNDLSAGLMAEYVISWLPYSRKAGGWVYKSWRDWLAECGISQNVVNRVRRSGVLESIGFEIERKKANGAPTLHYRLNISKFIESVANFLQVSVSYVQGFFGLATKSETSTAAPQNEAPTEQLTTTAESATNSVCVESTKSISDDADNAFVENLRTLYMELQKSITEAQTNALTSEQSDDNRRRAINAYWDKIIATGHLGMSTKQIEEYEAKKAQQVVVENSSSNAKNTPPQISEPITVDENHAENIVDDIPVELPGLTKREIKRYTRKHGEEVVRQVIEYAKEQTSLHTPAAWVKSVLRNAVIDLSEYGITENGTKRTESKYAAFIQS